MNLLLINLSLRPDSFQCIFPIGIGYIATALREAGIDFDLLDMDVHKGDIHDLATTDFKKYDVVAFGCIVTGYRIVKEVSRIIRETNPNVTIICGNTVASSIPIHLLLNTEVDIAVMGEGDIAIVEIINTLKKGKFKGIYKADRMVDVNKLPILKWDLFDMSKYLKRNRNSIAEPHPVDYSSLMAMPVNSARGCIHNCSFCYNVFQGEKYRYRSVDSLSKEMDFLKSHYDINYITFYDDLTLFSKRRVEEFIDLMTGRGIHWTACCRAGLFTRQDRNLLRKLKRSNCVSLGYSLESANKHILKAMNKHISLESFEEQKKALTEADIATITSLVLAYPQETERTLAQTFNFCYKNDIYPSTGYLQPQPGTPMYDYALKNDYITNQEEYLMQMGDRQDLHINMSKIPSERLQQLTFNHLKRIRDKLKLPLRDDQLIKTGIMRGAK
ncbi:hypothetical protein LCGC14_1458990 [marine sediment metagenome]|uniref:Uncharacterized protein n=1 Tax=marine sediment metagenome TaxID=412755 RepID=A0A0F9LWA1_9ZZZZ